MCDECQNLETKIQRYRRFVRQGLDALTTKRIVELIKELERRKEAMHQGRPA
jgi:hypothetical protein